MRIVVLASHCRPPMSNFDTPELSTKWIHEPWKAPAEALTASGIKLGSDYPLPIVDHSEARGLALQAFQHLKQYR